LVNQGGRVSERTAITAGALVGSLIGGFAGFLFFTERGRGLRDRMEPMVDDLRGEFMKFQRTLEKVGDMANEGMRVVNEFNAARQQSPVPGSRTSH
jgi:gas vesicle protein